MESNRHLSAWMGPWGYVLAHQEGKAQAIATVKYDNKPFILGRPDLKIGTWSDDAKGPKISFADVGSTFRFAGADLLVMTKASIQNLLHLSRRHLSSDQYHGGRDRALSEKLQSADIAPVPLLIVPGGKIGERYISPDRGLVPLIKAAARAVRAAPERWSHRQEAHRAR